MKDLLNFAEMKELEKADFFIEIDFKKDTENPSRIFQTMSELIKSFQELDNDLIKGIDSKIDPVILLEDVEIGSLKVWLVQALKGIPDESIKELEWKKAVGHYLLKAKYFIINKLEGKTAITDAQDIKDIQYELLEEAKNTDIKLFPAYSPIPLPKLLDNIDKINKSLQHLGPGDSAFIQTGIGSKANFNLELSFSPEDMEDLLTKESLRSTSTMILKVKKPDYLGNSMWDFKHGSRTIHASITDANWLSRFQSRLIDIRPGDSIRASVQTIVKYGYDNELVGQSYEIVEVKEIIPMNPSDQTDLPW